MFFFPDLCHFSDFLDELGLDFGIRESPNLLGVSSSGALREDLKIEKVSQTD